MLAHCVYRARRADRPAAGVEVAAARRERASAGATRRAASAARAAAAGGRLRPAAPRRRRWRWRRCWLPLSLAVPFIVLTGHPRAGRLAQRLGLLRTPEEATAAAAAGAGCRAWQLHRPGARAAARAAAAPRRTPPRRLGLRHLPAARRWRPSRVLAIAVPRATASRQSCRRNCASRTNSTSRPTGATCHRCHRCRRSPRRAQARGGAGETRSHDRQRDQATGVRGRGTRDRNRIADLTRSKKPRRRAPRDNAASKAARPATRRPHERPQRRWKFHSARRSSACVWARATPSMARASSRSPRPCCNRAWPTSAATRARRCRTCST